jgi:hypothetical protein
VAKVVSCSAYVSKYGEDYSLRRYNDPDFTLIASCLAKSYSFH